MIFFRVFFLHFFGIFFGGFKKKQYLCSRFVGSSTENLRNFELKILGVFM